MITIPRNIPLILLAICVIILALNFLYRSRQPKVIWRLWAIVGIIVAVVLLLQVIPFIKLG